MNKLGKLIAIATVGGLSAAALPSSSALAAACGGLTFGASYAGRYTCDSLGAAPGVTIPYGGVTFLNNNTLLLGGAANTSAGVIDEIGITRGPGNQITGFSGGATLYATAPYVDGGLTFGPGGVLFFTGYPNNTLGQITPGGSSPATILTLDSSLSSVGSISFVPGGFAGAGSAKIVSYDNGNWAHATLTPDGSGTYNVATSVVLTIPNPPNPEGEVYVSGSNAGFGGHDSLLLAAWLTGAIDAYQIDANGDPILATESTFISGLTGAEGAVIDPLTGDFIFSTFVAGGGDQVVVISGFRVPTPEPVSIVLLGSGLAGLGLVRRKRAR